MSESVNINIELEALRYTEELAKNGKWPIATPPVAKEAYATRIRTPEPPLGWFNDPNSPLYGFPPQVFLFKSYYNFLYLLQL